MLGRTITSTCSEIILVGTSTGRSTIWIVLIAVLGIVVRGRLVITLLLQMLLLVVSLLLTYDKRE